MFQNHICNSHLSPHSVNLSHMQSASIDFKENISRGSNRTGLRTETKENADTTNMLRKLVDHIVSGYLQTYRESIMEMYPFINKLKLL